MNKKNIIPEKTRVVGGSGEGTRKIYISRETYKEIFTFSKDKNVRQCGGVLLGNIFEENGCKYVIIRAFIEGKHSDGTSNSITFTKETWSHIDKEKENYPEYDIVGWMHTNPDTGRKATEYDLFFHTHMFENKDIVAYIVDPVQIVEAFYFLEENQLVRSDGFYVFTEAVMPKIRPNRKSIISKEDNLEELEVVEIPESKENSKSVERKMPIVTMEVKSAEKEIPIVTMDVKTAEEQIPSDNEKNIDDVEEIRQAFEKAERKVEEDTSDIEAYAGTRNEKIDAEKESTDKEKSVEQDAEKETLAEAISGVSDVEKETLVETPSKKKYVDNEVIVEDSKENASYKETSTERNLDNGDELNVAIPSKKSSKVTVVVAMLSIIVIALAATIGFSINRIYQLEKEIDRLYNNDEIIAKYINTGSTEESISTNTEETVANSETAEATSIVVAETAAAVETTATDNAETTTSIEEQSDVVVQ